MKVNRYFSFIALLWFLHVIPVAHAQQAPQLISPEDGATGLPTTILFHWSNVSDADIYQIQISENQTFQNIAFQQNTSSNSIQVSGFPQGETFYWRVRSGQIILLVTEYGPWSESRSFSTAPPIPAAPALVSPENGAESIASGPNLNWEPSDNADSYRIQVAETQGFSDTVLDESNLTETEIRANELRNSTTYYWRVNATNESGSSDWSDVWSFTTLTDPPSTPNLITPDNGATDVSTNPMLEWEEVEIAESYDFQIALDENFGQMIVNQSNVTSTHYQGNFDEYTTHYWRVRARNKGGESDWSEVWNFTTELGDDVISINTPVFKELLKGGENHTIRWRAPNTIQEVIIEYSTQPGNNWFLINDSVTASPGSYSWTIPDSSSVHTRIKITDTENPEIYAISAPFILYPGTINIEQQLTFNSAQASSDYKLIGLPLNSAIPVDQIFIGTAGRDWNAYFDNGHMEDYLVPFDSSEVFTFRPGKAFWVISRSDVQINETIESVELSPDTTFAIDLQPGWNIISNPFAREIQWSSVQEKNEIEDPIWSFNGTFQEQATFDVFQGYYFYNRNELTELYIPYVSDIDTQSDKPNQKRIETNTITLHILQYDKIQSSIEIGFHSNLPHNAEPKFDFAPPGDFQSHRVSIQSEQLSPNLPQLSRLFFPYSEELQTIDLIVKSPANTPLHLQIEGIRNLNTHDVLLFDKKYAKTYDLHREPILRINSYDEIKKYSLVIGKPGTASVYFNENAPQQTSLSQNYPNPFNNQTVIEYTIAQNNAGNRVVLGVFNVLGQLVATLVDEYQPAGSYQVHWDTDNNPGYHLASGLYFYRLQVGDMVKTRHLTLIK